MRYATTARRRQRPHVVAVANKIWPPWEAQALEGLATGDASGGHLKNAKLDAPMLSWKGEAGRTPSPRGVVRAPKSSKNPSKQWAPSSCAWRMQVFERSTSKVPASVFSH